MACGACGRRHNKDNNIEKSKSITDGYKYLTDRQIKARLEVYKRRFCKDCSTRYTCDYTVYFNCLERLK
ncbi:MAG TPA: hypothetical protein VI911_07945 [Patescibacteria group bacterium]|nr:hypothetical protein [Patescibacteria group bacterium]